MVAAYCVECAGIFELAGPARSPGSERRVQLRAANCPLCHSSVQIVREDDFHPDVLALMAEGPQVRAAVLEAYTIDENKLTRLLAKDIGLLDLELDASQLNTKKIAIILLALAAFVGHSKANIEVKFDLNRAIDQIISLINSSPQTQGQGQPSAEHKEQADTPNAKSGAGEKHDETISHTTTPKTKKR